MPQKQLLALMKAFCPQLSDHGFLSPCALPWVVEHLPKDVGPARTLPPGEFLECSQYGPLIAPGPNHLDEIVVAKSLPECLDVDAHDNILLDSAPTLHEAVAPNRVALGIGQIKSLAYTITTCVGAARLSHQIITPCRIVGTVWFGTVVVYQAQIMPDLMGEGTGNAVRGAVDLSADNTIHFFVVFFAGPVDGRDTNKIIRARRDVIHHKDIQPIIRHRPVVGQIFCLVLTAQIILPVCHT